MATPMRSTDFRSVVEPILNEVFDGVYDQRADEWKQVFREQKGIPRNYHEEPVLYGFGAALSFQMAWLSLMSQVVFYLCSVTFTMSTVLHLH